MPEPTLVLKSHSTQRGERQAGEQFKLNFSPVLWCLTNSESNQAQDFDLNHASLCLKILADDS